MLRLYNQVTKSVSIQAEKSEEYMFNALIKLNLSDEQSSLDLFIHCTWYCIPSRSSCLLFALATLSISKIECLASVERTLCLKFSKN